MAEEGDSRAPPQLCCITATVPVETNPKAQSIFADRNFTVQNRFDHCAILQRYVMFGNTKAVSSLQEEAAPARALQQSPNQACPPAPGCLLDREFTMDWG